MKSDSQARAANHPSGISRRAFIKLSGLALAAAAAGRLLGRRVLGAGSSAVAPPERGGVVSEIWVPTSCLNCATRCATRVRVVNDRAVKITGNPLSRVSEGENCARAHVGVQVLYDPARLTAPMLRTNATKGRGIDPRWEPISWEEALREVGGRLGMLREQGRPERLLLLTGLNSVSDEDIISRFATAYGTPNMVVAGGLDNEADRAGQWLADGHYTQSAYDLERTSYILSFGASILESYKPLARSLRMWGKIRRERPNRAKVVVIDPRCSVTALRADRWLPIAPGTDAALAMALANVIIEEGLYDVDFVREHTAGFEEYREVTRQYSPETAAGITGIPAETIRGIAREFAGTKPAIAWRGRGATAWPGGSYTSYAIFCLNALVGSIDAPGGVIYQEGPPYQSMPDAVNDDIQRAGLAVTPLDGRGTARFPAAQVATNHVADAILEGQPYPVELAIGFNADFNMTAPGTPRWDEAMAQLPYYVHVSSFASEMAEYADLLLPAPAFLEAWAYDHSPPGSGFAEVRLKQPVVRQRYDTMAVGDIVFGLAGRVGGTVAESFHDIGDSAYGFLRYRVEPLQDWQQWLDEGVWVGPAYRYRKYDEIFRTPSKKFEFRSGNLEARLKELGQSTEGLTLLPHHEPAGFLGDAGEYPLLLSSYQPLLDVENGGQDYPWAQEMYLVAHGAGWTNFAEMNSRTAREIGVKDYDEVWVESAFGRLRTRARVFEGIRPGVVSIARGQGHYANGRWSNGIGVNPNDITGVDYDRLSGQAAFFNTRVRVYKD
jgi:anaerobic selenocysteine-containing dehydrogenase